MHWGYIMESFELRHLCGGAPTGKCWHLCFQAACFAVPVSLRRKRNAWCSLMMHAYRTSIDLGKADRSQKRTP